MTDMNLGQLIDILNKFDIRNVSDLERRLENGAAPETSNGAGWHDGYVQGFQKASKDQIERLNSEVERLAGRVQIIERNLLDAETRVAGLSRPRPAAKRGKRRK